MAFTLLISNRGRSGFPSKGEENEHGKCYSIIGQQLHSLLKRTRESLVGSPFETSKRKHGKVTAVSATEVDRKLSVELFRVQIPVQSHEDTLQATVQKLLNMVLNSFGLCTTQFQKSWQLTSLIARCKDQTSR